MTSAVILRSEKQVYNIDLFFSWLWFDITYVLDGHWCLNVCPWLFTCFRQFLVLVIKNVWPLSVLVADAACRLCWMLDYYCLPISIVSLFFPSLLSILMHLYKKEKISNFCTENRQIRRDKNVKPNTKILSFLKSQSLKIKTILINNFK